MRIWEREREREGQPLLVTIKLVSIQPKWSPNAHSHSVREPWINMARVKFRVFGSHGMQKVYGFVIATMWGTRWGEQDHWVEKQVWLCSAVLSKESK